MQVSQKDILLVVIRSFFAFAFVFHRSRWQNGNRRHKRCSSTRISSKEGRTSRASRARAIRASRVSRANRASMARAIRANKASRIDSIRLNMSTRTLNLINLNSLNLNLSTLNLLTTLLNLPTTLHNLFTTFNLLTTLTILLNILTAFTALSITVFFYPKMAGRTNWNRWPSRLYLLSTSSLGRGYRNATFIKNLLSPTMKGNQPFQWITPLLTGHPA